VRVKGDRGKTKKGSQLIYGVSTPREVKKEGKEERKEKKKGKERGGMDLKKIWVGRRDWMKEGYLKR